MTGRGDIVPMRQGVLRSAGHVRHAEERRDRLQRTWSSSICRASSQRWRGRAVRTTASTCPISRPSSRSSWRSLSSTAVTARRTRWTERCPTGKPGIDVGHGDVLISAITSCTNTSNPGVLLGAGLLAKKAVEKGLKPPARVKTSLGPGSLAVTEYLKNAGLLPYLEQLGYYVAGYGCTTCIGNSGPLDTQIEDAVTKNDIVGAAVLSGNRNFEARIHQAIRANFLMSPPLVVAFGLAGTVNIDMSKDPIGNGKDGKPVYLRDIWPDAGRSARRHEVRDRSRDVQESIFRVQGRQSAVGRDSRLRSARRTNGTEIDLRAACRRTSKASACSPATSRTSKARACSAYSAIRSRPTTSARPAAYARAPLRANICRSTASQSATSIRTARAAATMK